MTPEFAVCNQSAYDHVSFLFAVESWRLQALEFAKDWGVDAPMVSPYSDVSLLPVDATWTAFILNALDDPQAAAYHTNIAGRPLLKMLAQYMPSDGSHEVLETIADSSADRWVAIGDGREQAVEVCDPVQADTYGIEVNVAGETRTVQVSDYVLPPYWDRSLSGPTRKMEALGLAPHLEPFGIALGGYAVVLGRDGNETEVFGQTPGRKLLRPDSRLFQRLRGKRA